jgi:hypothetical protein
MDHLVEPHNNNGSQNGNLGGQGLLMPPSPNRKVQHQHNNLQEFFCFGNYQRQEVDAAYKGPRPELVAEVELAQADVHDYGLLVYMVAEEEEYHTGDYDAFDEQQTGFAVVGPGGGALVVAFYGNCHV